MRTLIIIIEQHMNEEVEKEEEKLLLCVFIAKVSHTVIEMLLVKSLLTILVLAFFDLVG
jgi:hypothetical protein